MKSKIKQLFKTVKASQILISNFSYQDPFFYYFTQLPFNHYKHSFLVLKKNSKPLLFVSPLEFSSAKKLKNFKVKAFSDRLFKDLQKEFSSKKMGFNAAGLSKKEFSFFKKKFKGKKFEDVSKQLFDLRFVKTKKELKSLKKACSIAQKTLNSVPQIFKKNMTEKELALELEFVARDFGADSLSFPAIVALKKNSSQPHHIPSNKKISKGLLLIDFGVKKNNYCSDITRMFSVGKPSKKHQELYSWLFGIQRKTISMLKPKAKLFSLQKFVEKKLNEKNFNLIHSIGHGIGIQTHDFPPISKKTNIVAEKNMVFAVEPAFYLKNFGMRIEDNVVVQKKPKLLTFASKKLEQI